MPNRLPVLCNAVAKISILAQNEINNPSFCLQTKTVCVDFAQYIHTWLAKVCINNYACPVYTYLVSLCINDYADHMYTDSLDANYNDIHGQCIKWGLGFNQDRR